MSNSELDSFLTDIARVSLAANKGSSLALAGAGALRAHFLTARPTEDVDLFFVQADASRAQTIFHNVETALQEHGFTVETLRSFSAYALLMVSKDGMSASVDIGSDYRAHPPVVLSVGPVLHKEDAVGNKVAAVFSRGKLRDCLDLQSLRDTGLFSDEKLLTLAQDRDGGFDRKLFANVILRLPDFSQIHKAALPQAYELSQGEYERVRHELKEFAERILQQDEFEAGKSLTRLLGSTDIEENPSLKTNRTEYPSSPSPTLPHRRGRSL